MDADHRTQVKEFLASGRARIVPEQAGLPPTPLHNDYLGAAAAVAALRRRALEGGSWRARVDLAQVCMWVQDLGLFPPSKVAALPRPSGSSIPAVTTDGPFGTVVQPGLPLRFTGMPTPTPGPAHSLGAGALEWQERLQDNAGFRRRLQ